MDHFTVPSALAYAEVNSLTDSDEECLRPSLLRKRHQLSSQSVIPHRENIPWNCQSMTPDHKASRAAATAYDSPAHQTPFAALFSSCPSIGIDSKAAVSPAEHNLFGNPTPNSMLGAFSPTPGASGYASASVQHQARSSHGMSKLVTHISSLKKQHAQLTQQLQEHQHRQQQWDLQLKDEAFLQHRLQQLTGASHAIHSHHTQDVPAALHSDSRPAGRHGSLEAQPAQTDTLELWQQLSSESSSSNEGHQVEELQAQLHHSNQHLHSKEAEVVGLTVELVSLHTQLETAQTESAQHLEAAQAELVDSVQRLETAQAQVTESAQQAETALESTHRRAEALSAELEQSGAAFGDVNRQLQAAEEALTEHAASQSDLKSAATASEQSWRDQLSDSQQQIEAMSCQVAQTQESNSQLRTQLVEARQQLEQVSHAHVMDESTMLDQVSDAQAESQRLAEELAQARAAQAEVSEQAAELRQQLAELQEGQTLTEATLLDQLTGAQTAVEGSSVQVRHLEQRHQEMCQQLILARVGQAEAMGASRDAKQLQEQVQAAQSDHQGALEELAHTQKLLYASEQEVHQHHLQMATRTRELSESGMQRFELSQTLQKAQTQLAAQLELSGKLQARAKKYRASHNSLCMQLEAAKTESAASRQQSADSAGALQQELVLTRERLELTVAELAQAIEAQALLQQQAEAGKQQAHAQAEVLSRQLSESSQQLSQSNESLAQLREQLQVATCSLAESQKQCSQACSDSVSLRFQLAETASQLEQSCSRQAEYALDQQRTANELAGARTESERLARNRAQAEAICQASDAQLKDLQQQHRKVRAKCEQLAVRSARHEALHADLSEAQAQLGTQCARLQIEEQKAEVVSRRLVVAGRNLADALYSTHAGHSQLTPVPGQAEECTELSSAAEQVCCLVQALLLHYNHSYAHATGGQESAAVTGQSVDVLRSHVAEAQARANHIVEEFESMLMVTGGHSMKEVLHLQSQAGLASNSPPAAKGRKPAPAAVPARRQSSSATQTSNGGPSSGRSSLNGGRSSQAACITTAAARRSVKSSATSKENKAPGLTYVVGGQIRGSRKPHDVLIRHPLKPNVTNTRSTCV